jgi:hypothetical protein
MGRIRVVRQTWDASRRAKGSSSNRAWKNRRNWSEIARRRYTFRNWEWNLIRNKLKRGWRLGWFRRLINSERRKSSFRGERGESKGDSRLSRRAYWWKPCSDSIKAWATKLILGRSARRGRRLAVKPRTWIPWRNRGVRRRNRECAQKAGLYAEAWLGAKERRRHRGIVEHRHYRSALVPW